MDKIKKTFEDLRRKARESSATRWSRKELGQINLFKGVHQEGIAPFLRDSPVRVLDGGEVLLSAGEPCPSLFLVLSGRLRIESPFSSIPDTLVRAGDCVGELFILEKTVVASSISAVEPTRLLVIERDVAWKLISASHQIARNWLALFGQRTGVSSIIAGCEEIKTTHVSDTTTDEHTGLHNRRWLDAMLPRHIARCAAGSSPLALLLVEIDSFADYGVRFGQAAADQAHRSAAQILVDNVRPTDLVVSYDATQFAVVLPESDAASGCLVGERMRKAISQANELNGLTISVGVTEYKPSTDALALLAAAEAALKLVKSRGGNRVGM